MSSSRKSLFWNQVWQFVVLRYLAYYLAVASKCVLLHHKLNIFGIFDPLCIELIFLLSHGSCWSFISQCYGRWDCLLPEFLYLASSILLKIGSKEISATRCVSEAPMHLNQCCWQQADWLNLKYIGKHKNFQRLKIVWLSEALGKLSSKKSVILWKSFTNCWPSPTTICKTFHKIQLF